MFVFLTFFVFVKYCSVTSSGSQKSIINYLTDKKTVVEIHHISFVSSCIVAPTYQQILIDSVMVIFGNFFTAALAVFWHKVRRMFGISYLSSTSSFILTWWVEYYKLHNVLTVARRNIFCFWITMEALDLQPLTSLPGLMGYTFPSCSGEALTANMTHTAVYICMLQLF